jgi:Ca-activated chloride channel homolog
MFRFAHPTVFWLLLLVLLMGLYFLISSRRNEKHLLKIFGPKMVDFFLAGFSRAKRNWKAFLCLATLSLMIVAMARPQMGKGQQQITSQGVEIMMVVDVSNSMLAEDVKPSRLGHAQKEMSRLLDLLGGDKVGLIAFAGSAVLLSPMTTDKSALKMFLESMSPASVETQGTEITKALQEAQSAFQRGGEEAGPNQKMTRVVVLISDGEDHEEGAIRQAQDMAKEGIRIFTMAFGSERGGKIPKRDGRGLLKGHVKDKQGQDVITKVNQELMRQIARAGEGSFYHVTFGGSQMKNLKEDIDKLEKTEFDSLSSESFDERYQLPLFLAFLLGLAELFIGTRRRKDNHWRGRFVN